MHGIIFSELRTFFIQKSDPNSWQQLLKDVGIGFKHYLPIQEYPDHEMFTIVEKLANQQSRSVTDLLEDFGLFIVPTLMDMYRTLIKPEWRTLDLIEHTEETIHKVVRLENQGASPPALKCVRKSVNVVEVVYNSERKVCPIAKGIIRGIAKHYNEDVSISESKCMTRGDHACCITVKLAK